MLVFNVMIKQNSHERMVDLQFRALFHSLDYNAYQTHLALYFLLFGVLVTSSPKVLFVTAPSLCLHCWNFVISVVKFQLRKNFNTPPGYILQKFCISLHFCHFFFWSTSSNKHASLSLCSFVSQWKSIPESRGITPPVLVRVSICCEQIS